MATTPRGYFYPTAGTSFRPHLDMQAGLTNVDTDVQNIFDKSLGKPLCILSAQSIQAIPHNASTPLNFNTEIVDTHGFHSTSSLTDRIVPTVAGWYTIRGVYFMTSRTNGYAQMEIGIKKNGSSLQIERIGDGVTVGGGSRSVSIVITADANGTTDYFQACGLHFNGDGVTANTNASGAFASRFEFVYERPL